MQIHYFDNFPGRGLAHKVTLPGRGGRFSIWWNGGGELDDAEQIIARCPNGPEYSRRVTSPKVLTELAAVARRLRDLHPALRSN